jgi:hypothetical protein
MKKACGHTTVDSMIPLSSVFFPVAINAQTSVKTIKLFSSLLANVLERVFVPDQPLHTCQHSQGDFIQQASA